MSEQPDSEPLVAILQVAYSGELTAAYAYHGHWHSLNDDDERMEEIENDEWHHRQTRRRNVAQFGL